VTTDPLFVPTLSEREPVTGPLPWRLESLYLLAFFGGGAAAAMVSARNARRLGLTPRTSTQLLLLGTGFVLFTGLLAGCAIGFSLSLDDPDRIEQWRQTIVRYRVLTPLVSVGFAWFLVRLQIRADRLYQIERAGEDEYSSMWVPGVLSALMSMVATLAAVVIVVLSWRALA
jgi:hypothetical protein